ncbi:MAG: hypothetical protein RL033_2102 [Pseudomonadota bacterium]
MRVHSKPGRLRFVLAALASLFCALIDVADVAAAPDEPPPPSTPPPSTPPGSAPAPTPPAAAASATPNAGSSAAPSAAPQAKGVVRAPLEKWRIIDSQSGPVNYYKLLQDGGRSIVRGSYQPPNKKAVLGFEVPERSRNRLRRLEWSWRAIKFPEKGDECVKERGDSSVVLYVTWRRFLRWYSLKYVWSTTRKPGTICDRRRNAFVAQDTVVLQSGGPPGVWKRESIDLTQEFRNHFGEGNERAEVPPLMGLGVMTDGDQTKTESTGDFADFVLSP